MIHECWFSWYAGDIVIHGEVLICETCGEKEHIVTERKRINETYNKERAEAEYHGPVDGRKS